jgi:hypothetical protein
VPTPSRPGREAGSPRWDDRRCRRKRPWSSDGR